MKLSQFKFKLPEELIALEPSYHRDECRLMVVHRKSGTIDMFQKDDKGHELKDADGNPVYMDFRNVLDYLMSTTHSYSTTRKSSRHVSTARRRRQRQRLKCSCCVS